MPFVSPEIARKREAVVKTHVEAENRHDTAGVISTFDRPTYELMPLGAVLNGPEPVADFLDGVFAGFPDFAAHVPSLVHAEHGVIAEGHFTGTHQRDWSGIPATGRSVDVPFCALFIFEDERLVSERLYFDFATLLRQLGALT